MRAEPFRTKQHRDMIATALPLLSLSLSLSQTHTRTDMEKEEIRQLLPRVLLFINIRRRDMHLSYAADGTAENIIISTDYWLLLLSLM